MPGFSSAGRSAAAVELYGAHALEALEHLMGEWYDKIYRFTESSDWIKHANVLNKIFNMTIRE